MFGPQEPRLSLEIFPWQHGEKKGLGVISAATSFIFIAVCVLGTPSLDKGWGQPCRRGQQASLARA